MGTDKTLVELAGRPLLHHALAALEAVVDDIAVVAKHDTPLPALDGRVETWIEPEREHHPLLGVRAALRRAAGRSVLVVPVDLPLVGPDDLQALLAAAGGDRAAIARAGGRLQPLLGVYPAAALAVLDTMDAGEAAGAVVARLDPVLVEVAEEVCLNVNTPADLERAAQMLSRR
jgi:molybdopterin-guanine dinucleotide biosynthesis protein A